MVKSKKITNKLKKVMFSKFIKINKTLSNILNNTIEDDEFIRNLEFIRLL